MDKKTELEFIQHIIELFEIDIKAMELQAENKLDLAIKLLPLAKKELNKYQKKYQKLQKKG